MTIGRVILAAAFSLLLTAPAAAWAQDATEEPSTPSDSAPQFVPDGKVRAVFFYSTHCPHCYTVMRKDLPPIQELFGDRLEIVFLNTSDDYADLLYDIVNTKYGIEGRHRGVPMMVVGEHAMVGGGDIRTKFPVLVASYIEQGGVDWPDVPGLRDVIGLQVAVKDLTEQPPAAAAAPPTAMPPVATQMVHGAPGVGPTPNPGSSRPTTEPAKKPIGTPTEVGDEPPAEKEPTRISAAERTKAALGSEAAGAAGTDDSQTPQPGEGESSAAASQPIGESSVAPDDAAATSAVLALAGVEAMPTLPASAFAPPEELSVGERVMLDPVGNGLSVVVLLLMVVCLVGALRPAAWQQSLAASKWPGIAIPILAIAGIVVAAYMAYVETTLNVAYCGPVGDCNAVQQSDYANIFGMPVALLGVMGFAAVLGLWATTRWASETAARWAWAFLFVVAIVGVVFSMYLTFLEPFVIGATCAWCLTSAVLMTGILLLSSGRGHEALQAEPRPSGTAGA